MKITVTNSRSQSVTFSGDQTKYQVTSVTGLDPGKAQINTTKIIGVDGSRFNSASLNNRNIVINFKCMSSAIRRDLYQKFPLKEKVSVSVSTDITATIEGYVDAFSCDLFGKNEMMQLSILCDDPLFRGTNWTGSHTWQVDGPEDVDLVNNGDADAGVYLEFHIDKYMEYLEVYYGSAYLRINYTTTVDGGIFRINTDEKTITYQAPGGRPVSVISALDSGSEFFKIKPGNQTISVDVYDVQFATVYMTVSTRLGGM